MKICQQHRQCKLFLQSADDHCLFTACESRWIGTEVFFNTSIISFNTSTSSCNSLIGVRNALSSTDPSGGSVCDNDCLGILFFFIISPTIPHFRMFSCARHICSCGYSQSLLIYILHFLPVRSNVVSLYISILLTDAGDVLEYYSDALCRLDLVLNNHVDSPILLFSFIPSVKD